MLAHSPLLPLTVDYFSEDGITAEDEERILLALGQRHRVRHLRLTLPVQNLQKIVMAIDEEFPILEYLIVRSPTKNDTPSVLPETLQAPHLRHLMLARFACPIRSRLHPTAPGLVTLYLLIEHQSTYFRPNTLIEWISFMPQLENLQIIFTFPVPNRDVERQLVQAPITTHITLPNLHYFGFRGVGAYFEAVLCRITTPHLKTLKIRLFNQLTFSIPRLPQFMNTAENLRFDDAVINFEDKEFHIGTFASGSDLNDILVRVDCCHLDWQVSSVVQLSKALSQTFSTVERLALQHEVHNQSSEEHNEVDRIQWRNFLRSFSGLKTLHVEDGLVEDLSRCLQLEDGELPLELLSELQELTYFASRDAGDAFTSFIDARQSAGRPVTLVRHSPSPSPLSLEPPAMTLPRDEAGNDIET